NCVEYRPRAFAHPAQKCAETRENAQPSILKLHCCSMCPNRSLLPEDAVVRTVHTNRLEDSSYWQSLAAQAVYRVNPPPVRVNPPPVRVNPPPVRVNPPPALFRADRYTGTGADSGNCDAVCPSYRGGVVQLFCRGRCQGTRPSEYVWQNLKSYNVPDR